MKKLLLIILCFICFASLAQSDWDAVKVGTTDMQKIYVGENLVWEKGCVYGDLDDYEEMFTLSEVSNNCGTFVITSLSTAKTALNKYRDSSCGPTSLGGENKGIKNITIDSYVLFCYSSGISCSIKQEDRWCVIGNGYSFTSNSKIIHVEDGVITYVEYY